MNGKGMALEHVADAGVAGAALQQLDVHEAHQRQPEGEGPVQDSRLALMTAGPVIPRRRPGLPVI